MRTPPSPPTAGRREWIGLAVLALPCLLISMDLSVLHLAVPSLSADLRPSATELLWIVDIYGFLLAGSLITMGNVGDRIGRRRLLMIGAAAFGATSVVAAFSSSAEMLIAARALMGMAAATLMPSTLALIRHMFADPKQRAVAIGAWGTSLSLGGAIGPLAGGVLLQWFWWGSVLLIAVPVMLGLLALAPRLVPEAKDPSGARVDVRSTVLSVVALLAGVYAIKHAITGGMAPDTILAVAIAGVSGTLFSRRQARLVHPLIDLKLFRVPAFSASLSSNALGFGVLFGIDLLLVQYLQLLLGLSPLEAGLWTLPMFGAFMMGGVLAPQLLGRVRPGMLMAGGLGLASVGLLVLTQVDALPVFVAGSVVLAMGLSPVFTLATDMTIGTAPAERAGAASALSETSTELGGALGIAVIGSLGAALYRSAAPAGAGESLGGALADGESAEAAGGAFIEALHLTAGLSAALVAAAAVLVAVLLRRAQPAAEKVPGREGPDGRADARAVPAPAMAAVDGSGPAAMGRA